MYVQSTEDLEYTPHKKPEQLHLYHVSGSLLKNGMGTPIWDPKISLSNVL